MRRWKTLLAWMLAAIMLFSLPLGTAAESLPVEPAQSLDATQKNSINMLNYLAVLTQEINTAKNSRVFLEEAYSNLISNIYPNAVDASTLERLTNLLDTMEGYRMISVKRDRLKYVFDQNQARAMEAIIPKPLDLLSLVQSESKTKMVLSLLSLATDGYVNYTSTVKDGELAYIQDGWELDDAASAELHNSRREAFSYMIRMVGEYGLPGNLALSETAVNEFVAQKNNTNVLQSIQFLESNADTYRALGAYWLLLSQKYYQNGDYAKCLDAIAAYEALDNHIFRKDHDLASTLPVAIGASAQVLEGEAYVSAASRYADMILANTQNEQWELRYFAAQTFAELYTITNDMQYLQAAYDAALNNVNNLVSKQRQLNQEYLATVAEISAPKDASKEVKTETNNYNKQLREERKAAPPPVYRPLVLNLDLLFLMADTMGISEAERTRIDGILHENGSNLFLNTHIDNQYRVAAVSNNVEQEELDVQFTGSSLTIPVDLAAPDTTILLTVRDESGETMYEDWQRSKVERKSAGDLSSFMVTYESPSAKKHKYTAGATATIEVTVPASQENKEFSFSFVAEQEKLLYLLDQIKFVRVQ